MRWLLCLLVVGLMADAGGKALEAMPGDLRLRPESKAVDAGVTIPGVHGMFDGAGPDLGACELNRPLTLYGPRQP